MSEQQPRYAFWNGWGWQEYAVLVIIAVWLILELSLFSQFHTLPSPVYGGDVYYHFSVVNHIYNGNSPLYSSQFLEEYAHYPWIFHFTIALIAWLTGMSALTATVYAPLLTTLLSGIISYQLGKRVFGSKTFGVLFCLYWTTWQIPHAAPSPFAELVVWPLTVLALLWASEHSAPLWKRALAGIIVGICGLSQVVLWVASFLYLGLLMLWRILEQHAVYDTRWKLTQPSTIITSIKHELQWAMPIVVVALPIGLLFWYPGLFIYHGVTPNRWADYVASGDAFTFQALWSGISTFYYTTRSWITICLSALTLFGTIFVASRAKRFQVPILVFLTGWIGFVHPLFTIPLFNTSIGYYGFGYIFDLAKPLLFVTAIYLLYKSMPSDGLRFGVYAIAVVLFSINAYQIHATYDADQWTGVGRQENPMFSLAQEIIETAPESAVFLVTHEETGFALNALTGKKVMIARRTHASPFVDINKRVADTAVMLYGNDSSIIKELLAQYHITYLYEDFYSYQQQAQCDQYFDQLPSVPDASFACLRTTPEHADYLARNGITFTTVRARLDPASAVAPTFELLAIKPDNYTYILSHGKSRRQVNSQQGVLQKWVEIAP